MKKTVSLVLVLCMIAVAVIGFGTAANAQTLSNTEKALALINAFATGDADMARSLLSEDYIQHNLAYGTARLSQCSAILPFSSMRKMSKATCSPAPAKL